MGKSKYITIVYLDKYVDFPIQHSQQNKQTTEWATTVELYASRDTFVFDQGHVTKNQPISTVLVLLSESLCI